MSIGRTDSILSLSGNPLYALLDEAVRLDPYPVLAKLRAQSPLVTSDGSVIVGDYQTCTAVLRNPAMGSDTMAAPQLRTLLGDDRPALESIFFLDGPDHTRQRGLIAKAFTPRITARYEHWVQEIVDDLFEQFADRDSIDLVKDLATTVSMRVICELFDIAADDVEMLKLWSNDLALAVELPTLVAGFSSSEMFSAEEINGFTRTANAIHAYFADLIHKRRRNPGTDLVSSLIHTDDGGHKLARHEVTNALLVLFTAAHESVTNMLSNGVLALSRHRDQLAKLRDDPSIAPLLVDEVLRYDAPVHLITRVALAPTRVGELDVEPGTIVVLLLAAGNRDEAEYQDADSFVADRRTRSMNLALGAGAHFCIGSSLTKLEGVMVFRALAERFRDFDVDESSLAYRRHVVVRGLETMTVHLSR